jgi:hypothetical protein
MCGIPRSSVPAPDPGDFHRIDRQADTEGKGQVPGCEEPERRHACPAGYPQDWPLTFWTQVDDKKRFFHDFFPSFKKFSTPWDHSPAQC